MTLRNSTGPEIRQIIYRLKISATGFLGWARWES